MNISIERRVAISFTLVVTLILFLNCASFYVARDQAKRMRQANHSQQMRIVLASTLSQLEGAETTQRAYLLTRNPTYLQAYQSTLQQIEPHLTELTRLTADNPSQQQSLTVLRRRIAQEVEELQETIALRENRGSEAAAQAVRIEPDHGKMNPVRETIAAMDAAEKPLFLQYNRNYSSFSNRAQVVFALLCLIMFAAVAQVYLSVRHTNRARAAALQKVTQTLESITDGFLAVDRAWRFTYANVEAERITARKREELIGATLWECFPALIGTEFERQYRRTMQEKTPVHFESYHAPADKWYEVQIFPSEEGLSVYFRDVTLHKNALEKVRASETRFRAATEGSMDAFFLLDAVRDSSGQITDFVFVETNLRGELLMGLRREDMLGQKLCELRPVNRTRGFFEKYVQVVASRETLEEEFAIDSPGINAQWLRHQVVAVGDGIGITTRDITGAKRMEEQIEMQVARVNEARVQLEFQAEELMRSNAQLAEANAHLESLATTDGLTGLKNHRAFQEKLSEEFARASRYQVALSLLMIDVDQFKQFNDTFGHPVGDKILKQVAETLQTNARNTDFVARYGGEEFVVILMNTSASEAVETAERFREAIAFQHWEERAITISIGAASLYPAMYSATYLLEAADRALYAAKSGGRNCVTHANAVPLAPPVGKPAG